MDQQRRGRFRFWPVWLALAAILFAPPVYAHPVPRKAHDRTIIVRLGRESVVVEYVLEVDEWTVVFQDLPAVSDQVELTKLTKPDEFYETFTRHYAPILADNLIASVDKQPLRFRCSQRRHQVL